jgi:hypothetical protein
LSSVTCNTCGARLSRPARRSGSAMAHTLPSPGCGVVGDPGCIGSRLARIPSTRFPSKQKAIDRRDAIRERSLGCKRKMSSLTADRLRSCVRPVDAVHDRWPRWVPRSSPKHGCGFESRCNKRVVWIVGSTDRHLIQLFHPGITRGSVGYRRVSADCHARYCGPCQSGHLVVQSRPKPRGGSIA